jgi:hypothetical protein
MHELNNTHQIGGVRRSSRFRACGRSPPLLLHDAAGSLILFLMAFNLERGNCFFSPHLELPRLTEEKDEQCICTGRVLPCLLVEISIRSLLNYLPPVQTYLGKPLGEIGA